MMFFLPSCNCFQLSSQVSFLFTLLYFEQSYLANLAIICHLIACHSPLSTIHYCLSFPIVYHSRLSVSPHFMSCLLSAIPHCMSSHCLPFSIICHSPIVCHPHYLPFTFVCHLPLHTITHCLPLPIVCHPHCLSFTIICHSPIVCHPHYLSMQFTILPFIIVYLSPLYAIPLCQPFPQCLPFPIVNHSPSVCHSLLFVNLYCMLSSLFATYHYLPFPIVCLSLLSTIPQCMSILYHAQLSDIPHSLPTPIACHLPLSAIHLIVC